MQLHWSNAKRSFIASTIKPRILCAWPIWWEVLSLRNCHLDTTGTTSCFEAVSDGAAMNIFAVKMLKNYLRCLRGKSRLTCINKSRIKSIRLKERWTIRLILYITSWIRNERTISRFFQEISFRKMEHVYITMCIKTALLRMKMQSKYSLDV